MVKGCTRGRCGRRRPAATTGMYQKTVMFSVQAGAQVPVQCGGNVTIRDSAAVIDGGYAV